MEFFTISYSKKISVLRLAMNKLLEKIKIRTLLLVLIDLLLLAAVDGVALFVRFEFSIEEIPMEYINMALDYFPMRAVVTILIFILLRMYRHIWSNISVYDVGQMVLAVIVAYAVSLPAAMYLGYRMPRSVYFMQLFLQLFGFLGMRCSVRFVTMIQQSLESESGERIMLIGAGEAGKMLVREAKGSTRVRGKIICIIDDNEKKKGLYMEGIPIVGGRDRILSVAKAERITQIIFAIPTADAKEKKEILDICKKTNCRLRIIPGIYQLMNGEVTVDRLKDVQIEDLLGRAPVKLDQTTLKQFLGGKTILVTGGGGSIGSELCRQIAKYEPKTLIILDIYENNAYAIQQELIRAYGHMLDLQVEIASVRDKEKIYELFDHYRPQLVFHAAAHKHVPLMEHCPSEAIKNNIFGTYHVIRGAEKYKAEKFIMISTDKAVNPTNVMGATKRFCEMILQSRKLSSETKFCAVRFGNVLGSNGSVVPLFKKQIEEGGPITLTDRRIIRYFMTIPEAAQLVLEAGNMADNGQIFVLDMGEPVKILSLAENLIRLSGLEPYKDIDIIEVGLRPGEKLYEELLMSSETLLATENKKIFIEDQRALEQSDLFEKLNQLGDAVDEGCSGETLVQLLRDMVPTFYLPEEVNFAAQQKMENIPSDVR